MKHRKTKNPLHIVPATLAFCMASFLFGSSTAQMQARAPYSQEQILKVVKLNALSTSEIVEAVERRGVDFQVTPTVESEFQGAGARPEVIQALRKNYRTPVSSTTTTTKSGGTTSTAPPAKGAARVPPGPPLSKSEIITLLQSGASTDRVEQFVEVRGVGFQMTPEIAREITAAGGNRSLIGAISERAMSPGPGPSTPARGKPAGPDYDELTDQAIAAMQANNANYAIGLLQQAAKMDASRPTAYQLLGFAELYGRRDLPSAENSMRAAMDRGGSAVFYVYHDHDGFFNTYCEGSFFVSKTGVSYKAKDGNHTFETQNSLIKEAALNGFVGSQFGSFHLKLKDASKDKGKTFNFAPATRQKTESNLILRLIKPQ